LLLRFMLWLIDWCAAQPWAGLTVPVGLPVMLGLYGCLLVGTIAVHRAARRVRLPQPSSTQAWPLPSKLL